MEATYRFQNHLNKQHLIISFVNILRWCPGFFHLMFWLRFGNWHKIIPTSTVSRGPNGYHSLTIKIAATWWPVLDTGWGTKGFQSDLLYMLSCLRPLPVVAVHCDSACQRPVNLNSLTPRASIASRGTYDGIENSSDIEQRLARKTDSPCHFSWRGRVIPPVSADAHDVLAVHLVATFLMCSKDSRMFGIESCQIRSSWVVWTQLGWASWTNSGLDKFVKLSPEFLDFLAVAHSLIVSYAVHLYGPCTNLMGLPLGLLTWTRSYVVFSSLRQTLWSCFCWVNSLPIDFWRPPSVAFPSPIFIILFIDSKVSFFSVFRSFLIASSSSSFVNGCPSKSLSSWLPSLLPVDSVAF